MADATRPTRVNGLSPPYTPAQISTWVFLPLLVIEFLLVVSPILPLVASIPCTILFCCFAGASAGFAIVAMKIDPSDPRVLACRRVDDVENGEGVINPDEPTKQCWICDIQVGVKSMHCKFCNKCVDHFDHHCMWLNTCVGKANYKYFFRTMISINLMLLIQSIIQIVLIVDIYVDFWGSKERASDWFSVGTTIPSVAIMGTFLFFDVVSLSLIGQLLVFHLKLQKEGISTYEYIVRDNQKRRERNKKLEELKIRRQTAITKARKDGNSFLVLRLEKGGLVREKFGISCCDPLSLDVDQSSSNGHNRADTAATPDENTNGHR